jgi:hypothetical protein
MERLRHGLREEPAAPLAVERLPAQEEVREGAPVPPTVQVIWGPMVDAMSVAGMSVAEVRALLQGPYNIPAHAAAVVNGSPERADRRLEAGDVLEFVRLAGEKGACA